MIWLIPIVVLLITLYLARQAVYPQQNFAKSTETSIQSDMTQTGSEPATESSTQTNTRFTDSTQAKTSIPESDKELPDAAQVSIRTVSGEQVPESQTDLAVSGNQSTVQTFSPKNNVKPHEAPSLLFANNNGDSPAQNPNGDLEPVLVKSCADQELINAETNDEDDWDEVADVGDITMDISEMIKELNLRETDSPRLAIDTEEYSQLKTGQPGDVQPEKIVDVAGKLRKMLS